MSAWLDTMSCEADDETVAHSQDESARHTGRPKSGIVCVRQVVVHRDRLGRTPVESAGETTSETW